MVCQYYVVGSKVRLKYQSNFPGPVFGSNFWSGKVSEGLQYQEWDLLRKCSFGPLYFAPKFMITCPISVLVHFQIDLICTFGPDLN